MFFLNKSHLLKCTQNKFSVVMSQVGKVCLLTNFFFFFFFIYGQFSSLFVATNWRTAPAPNLITPFFLKFWWGFLRFFFCFIFIMCRRNTFKIIAKCRKCLNNGGKFDKNLKQILLIVVAVIVKNWQKLIDS